MAALQAHLPSFSAGKGTRRNHLLLQRLASASIEFYNGWLLPPSKKENFPFACDISPSKNCRPVGTKRVLRLTSMNDFYSTSQRRAVRLLVQHSSLKNTVSLLSSPIENETCSSRRGGGPPSWNLSYLCPTALKFFSLSKDFCLFVQPRRLGSTTRNNKVPRMLTPAGVLELVWPGTTMAKTLDVWIALSQQPRVFPWRRNKSHATYCKSKSQSLIVTIARCEPWACHWTEFWLKRPSAILHRA